MTSNTPAATVESSQPPEIADYIVFSSMKTGTQTITATLRKSGYGAQHCHGLANLELSPEQFREQLKQRRGETGASTTIISVFRLPIERHISSFFQWHGTGALGHVPGYTSQDSVIAKANLAALNALFVTDLAARRFVGYPESLHELWKILDLSSSDLHLDSTSGTLSCEHPLAKLVLIEFGDLFRAFPSRLGQALNIDHLDNKTTNTSTGKWYARKYKRFKHRVRIPAEVIERTYGHRQDLIDLFFPGDYGALLANAIQRYSSEEWAAHRR